MVDVPNNLSPKRVAIFLTGVDTGDDELSDVVSQVADDAEARGLFFEWAAIGDMEINDVVPGSLLHKALNGKLPDR